MKKRLLSALCAFCFAASLTGSALAATYTVTLTGQEAGGEVPAVLEIPAQTPADVGVEPDVLRISAPVKNAAVEIPVTGDAKHADVLILNGDGTYSTNENTVKSDDSVITMLPDTSAALILLKKPPFTDIAHSNWYYSGVAYAYHHGLMGGTSATKFSPGSSADRAMLVTILWRVEGQPQSAQTLSFSDVAAGKYYSDAVLWAAEQEIVTGSGGKFSPTAKITRETLAVMLYRYAAYQGADVSGRAELSAYSDSAKVSAWAKDAMAWAVKEGLITGSNGKLNPAGTASRAELAVILMRFLGDSI